jgi:nitrogen fixation protein FixH
MASAPKPLTGTKVFLMLVAFFGLVIGVNATMMKLAIATLPGTDVDSPYAAGLVYDREIAAAQDQAQRKWKVNAHVERSRDGDALLQVEVRDPVGQPIAGLKFGGRLERPTDKRVDLAVELTEAGIGIYRGHAAAVAPGQWDLVIEGEARGTRVFLSRNRVVLN